MLIHANELYKYDGQNLPELVKDINPGGDSNPSSLEVFNDKLYFCANNGLNGRELTEYDAVTDTVITYDLNEGPAGSNPLYLTTVLDKLYFNADDKTDGKELWVFDGINTPEVLANINTFSDSDPGYFKVLNSRIFFAADDGKNGRELWSYEIPPIYDTVCYSYISPGGKVLTETGTYSDTITDNQGNVSVRIIDLTVLNVNTTVEQEGDILVAKADGAKFQWLDCENNYGPLAGMNSDSLISDANGIFAVQIMQDGCVDTSECFQVKQTTGIIGDIILETFEVYPNPTSGEFSLVFNRRYDEVKILIRSISGSVLSEKSFQDVDRLNYELLNEPKGFYFLEIYTKDRNIKTIKVIKQ